MMDFENIQYLSTGTLAQQSAYQVLKNHQILEILNDFEPILVGTVPININIEGSDLDIICYCTDKAIFKQYLQTSFAYYSGFELREVMINQEECMVANFFVEGWEIEIFAQNIPTKQQFAYRHLLIEHQLLQEHGEAFRQKIMDLKQQGYKTEPAFAKVLGLVGNPYEALLALS
jgi:hypothetical protein